MCGSFIDPLVISSPRGFLPSGLRLDLGLLGLHHGIEAAFVFLELVFARVTARQCQECEKDEGRGSYGAPRNGLIGLSALERAHKQRGVS
jgi:hypothetical protein